MEMKLRLTFIRFLLGLLTMLPAPASAERVHIKFEKCPDDPNWFGTVEQVFNEFGHLSDILFDFPHGLRVSFRKLNQPNAFYSQGDHSILLGRELVLQAKDFFVSSGYSEREAVRRAIDVLVYVYLHELGHAAISELRIPVVGREEDAVDEFAAMLFVSAGKGDYAVAAADYYGIRAENYKQDFFSDTHSLDPQRFANIYALMYGSDPETFVFVKDMIPAERYTRAAFDFQKKWTSWRSLLRPYLRYDAFAKKPAHMTLELSPRTRRF